MSEQFSEQQAAMHLQMDESQLEVELGKHFQEGPTDDTLIMGPKDSLQEFGKRVFTKIGQQAFDIICGNKEENKQDRSRIMDALAGNKEATVASLVAGVLIAQLGWSVMVAGLVSALAVKLFFNPAYQTFCEMWKESME